MADSPDFTGVFDEPVVTAAPDTGPDFTGVFDTPATVEPSNYKYDKSSSLSDEDDLRRIDEEIKKASNQPIKATKWNEYNSTPPADTLRQEREKILAAIELKKSQPPTQTTQPVPQEPTGPDFSGVFDDRSTQNPDIIPYALNKLTQGVASVPAMGLDILGGVTNKLPGVDTFGDPFFAAAKDINEWAAKSWGMQEDADKNASFGVKAIGAGAQLVGTLPYMLLGRILGPVSMALTPATQTGKMLIDAGVDETKAAQIAATTGTAYGLLMGVATAFPSAVGAPMQELIKKYAMSAGATGGFNVVQGATERAVINKWLEQSDPEVAKLFQWADRETAGIEFLTGALLGPFAKYADDHTKSILKTFEEVKKKREVQQAVHLELMDMVVQGLDYQATPETSKAFWKHRFDLMDPADAKKTWEGIEKQFAMSPTDSQADAFDAYSHHSELTLDNYLGGIKHSDIYNDADTVDLKVTLKALERLGQQMNFGRIDVVLMDKAGSDYAGMFVPGNKWNGQNVQGDRIFLPKATGRANFETIVHEVGHAITSKMISEFEKGNVPKGMEAVYDRYTRVNENFIKAREQTVSNIVKNLSASERLQLERSVLPGDIDGTIDYLRRVHKYNLYGLKNLHEAISVAFESVDPSKNTTNTHRSGLEGFKKLPLRDSDGNFLFDSGATRDPALNGLWNDVWRQSSGLFTDVSDSNFLKSFYSQIFGLAENAPELYLDRAAMKNMAEVMSNEEMHRTIQIADILKNSIDDNTRVIKLRALSESPNWQMLLNERPDIIIGSAAKINALADSYLYEINNRLIESGANKGTLGTDKDKQVIAREGELYSPYKNVDQYMAAHGGELLKDAQDFDRQLLDKVLGPDQLKMMDKKNPLTKLLNFIFKMQQNYNGMEAKIFYDIMSHALLFKKLSETDQTHVMRFASIIDNDHLLRRDMEKAGKYWLDKVEIDQQVAKSGIPMSEQAKWAYWDMGNAMNRTWDLVDSFRKTQGLDSVKRIPNYMPHMWKGAYKVHVQAEVMRDGKMTKQTITVRGFNFKKEAEIYAARMKGQGFEIKPNDTPQYKGKDWHVVEMRDFDQGIVPTMMQDMDAYRNFAALDPEGQARLAAVDGKSIVGFTSHDMAQTGVRGYINDPMHFKYDTRDIVFGQRHRDHVDTLNLYENYVKQVVEHWKNVMYYHDVHKKLFGGAFDSSVDTNKYYTNTMARFPNMSKFMDAQVRNYTGEAVNAFKVFDQALIKGSVALGIPPYLYRQGVKSIRNLMSIVFTRYNPGNWAMNYIQPVHTFGILSWVDSRRRIDGLSHADLSTVISEVKRNFNNNNKELADALHWARQEHILDAQAEYQVRSKEAKSALGRTFQKVNLSNVPTKIEAGARETSFALAYTYYKRVLGDSVLARDAAAEVMGTSMVNYDRSRRPLMYQSYGVIGEMLSPFAVFRNAYAGNMVMMMKHALQNPKQFHAWKPFLTANAIFMFTAGVVGSVGFSEYDAIVRLLKKFSPETFGDMQESGAALTKLGVPEVVRLGALASLSKQIPGLPEGAAISGSGSVVGADDLFDPNIVPFITALAGLAVIGAKTVTGRGVTAEDKYAALTGILPGQLKYPLERYFQEEGVDTGFASKKLTGSVKRNIGDITALAITGKKSIREASEQALIRQAQAILESHKKGVKKLVTMATDKLMSGNTEGIDDYYARASEYYGITPEEFSQKIFDMRIERVLPAVDKILQGNENPLLADKLSEYIRKFNEGRARQ